MVTSLPVLKGLKSQFVNSLTNSDGIPLAWYYMSLLILQKILILLSGEESSLSCMILDSSLPMCRSGRKMAVLSRR